MRSRRSGPGWPLSDTKVSGRRVTCKAPLAHVEGGSGRPEVLPTAILQDTHSLEGEFSEVHIQDRAWNDLLEARECLLRPLPPRGRGLHVVVVNKNPRM